MILLSSCLDNIDDDRDEVESYFTLSVSGDATQNYEGRAGFGTYEDPDSGVEVFIIDLNAQTPNPGSGLRFVGKIDQIPGEQDFDVEEASLNEDHELILEDLNEGKFIANYVTNDQEVSEDNFIATDGVISITDREEEYLGGEFNLNAVSVPAEDDSMNIQIEGEFQAPETEFEASSE